MTEFKQGTRGYIPKDLQQLKRAAGGSVGTLTVMGQKMPEVLSLGKNVYATLKDVPPVLKAALSAEGKDIHTIKTAADATVFLMRFEVFNAP